MRKIAMIVVVAAAALLTATATVAPAAPSVADTGCWTCYSAS